MSNNQVFISYYFTRFKRFCYLSYHWDTLDYPKDKLEWIIVDDSKVDNSDNNTVDDNILYIQVNSMNI